MKSYCLLLAVLCSAVIIQDANSSKLRASGYTPRTYSLEITELPGKARDIGCGADGTIWIIGNVPEYNNYAIYRMQPGSTSWEKIRGQAWRISVAPDGNSWVTTDVGRVFKYVGLPKWELISGPSTASDISCSPDGNVYIVGARGALNVFNHNTKTWNPIGQTGTCVAGGCHGDVWYLDNAKSAHRSTEKGWEQLFAQGTDIAVGANSQTWLLTTGAAPDQFAVWDEAKGLWVIVPVSDYCAKTGKTINHSPVVRIAVAPNGDLLGCRKDLSIFRLSFKYT